MFVCYLWQRLCRKTFQSSLFHEVLWSDASTHSTQPDASAFRETTWYLDGTYHITRPSDLSPYFPIVDVTDLSHLWEWFLYGRRRARKTSCSQSPGLSKQRNFNLDIRYDNVIAIESWKEGKFTLIPSAQCHWYIIMSSLMVSDRRSPWLTVPVVKLNGILCRLQI